MNEEMKQTITPQLYSHIYQVLQEMAITSGRIGLLGELPGDTQAWCDGHGFELSVLNMAGFECEVRDVENLVALVWAISNYTDDTLKMVYDLCAEHKCILVVCAQNITYRDYAFRLIAGVMDYEEAGVRRFSEQHLNRVLCSQAFYQVGASDFQLDNSVVPTPGENILLLPNTLANQYLTWLKKQVDPNENVYTFIRAYIPGVVAKNNVQTVQEKSPFLSVITRTQGNRPSELRETLLCLSAQSDTDFEVLIIGHKVRPEDQSQVLCIIDELPSSMSAKVRYLPLDTGNRSAPLNHGFSMARGTYVAILDDDDLVMENWVEAFHVLAEKKPGPILHAYSACQKWKRGSSPESLYAVSAPEPTYCENFDFVRQLKENRCPTMSLAFPAWLFQHSTLRFDDTLHTTEDWDFLMRAVFIAGIVDTPELTSIYRLWDNAESSATVHDQQDWQDNYQIVTSHMRSRNVLLPKGGASQLVQLYQDSTDLQSKSAYNAKAFATMFWRRGEAFSTTYSVQTCNRQAFPVFEYIFRDLENDHIVGPTMLRIDPTEVGMVCLRDLSVKLTSANGDTYHISQEMITTTGCKIDGEIIALQEDIQLFVKVPPNFMLSEVQVLGCIQDMVPEPVVLELLDEIILTSELVVQPKGYNHHTEMQTRVLARNSAEYPEVCFEYDRLSAFGVLDEPFIQINGRFGVVLVENFSLHLEFDDGSTEDLGVWDCDLPALRFGEKALLFWEYHQIPIPMRKGKLLDSVTFKATLNRSINEDLYAIRDAFRFDIGFESILFADCGGGFSEETALRKYNEVPWPCFEYHYSVKQQLQNASKWRFDPTVYGGYLLQDLKVTLVFCDGEEIALTKKDYSINGYWWKDDMVFADKDPQVIFSVPKSKRLQVIVVSGGIVPTDTKRADAKQDILVETAPQFVKNAAVIYWDEGNGYTQENVQILNEYAVAETFHYSASFDTHIKLRGSLRFDPSEVSGVMVEDLKVIFKGSAGETSTVSMDKCTCNGFSFSGGMAFLKDDPQVYIPLPREFQVVQVTLTGNLSMRVPDPIIDAMMGKSIGRRALQKMRRKLKIS